MDVCLVFAIDLMFTDFGFLTSLVFVSLNSNRINGSIPSGMLLSKYRLIALYHFCRLHQCVISSSYYFCHCLTELGKLSFLFGLDVGSNKLSGSIPTGCVMARFV